jgi:hypothetical protein
VRVRKTWISALTWPAKIGEMGWLGRQYAIAG